MLKELDIDFSDSEYLTIQDTENTGRIIVATQDIPACTTLVVNKPLFYFNSNQHPPSKLTCETCLKFYETEDAIRELTRTFRGHLGYVHLLAEILSASEEKKEIFDKLDYCETDYEKSDNL